MPKFDRSCAKVDFVNVLSCRIHLSKMVAVNVIIERFVEAARAMRLAHEELPQALWAELINTAAYILNHTGPSSVEGKSPHELKKAEKGVLVGYEGDDGYRIFVHPGHKVCRSRDVIFDENIIHLQQHLIGQ